MAQITLFTDGTVEARYVGGCVYMDVRTFTDPAKTIQHGCDYLGLHGTPEQVRAFANAILAALPPVEPAERRCARCGGLGKIPDEIPPVYGETCGDCGGAGFVASEARGLLSSLPEVAGEALLHG